MANAEQRTGGESDALRADAAADCGPLTDENMVAEVLFIVHRRIGVDFRLYRQATVGRRIRNRMISVGAANLAAYLSRLRDDPDEAARLAERITIKVSRFYRNAHAFDFIRREVLPPLAARAGRPALRLWSAGCGQGEEAYTLAMLLDEAGLDGIVEASDIDAGALAAAERGFYTESTTAELPADLADRYLVPGSNERHHGYRIAPALRARVRFRRHDLTAAAPPPDGLPFDLVMCRNVLIYLGREAQQRALELVLRRIRPGGYLCLGEAEWPSPAAAVALIPAYGKGRVFRALVERGESHT